MSLRVVSKCIQCLPRDFLEVNLLLNHPCHVKDSTELPRESSRGGSLDAGLWSLRNTGALVWLESHQWQNTLRMSVFEKERRGWPQGTVLSLPLFWQIVVADYLYQRIIILMLPISNDTWDSCPHSAQLYRYLPQIHTKVIKSWENKLFAHPHNHLS